jgi:dienelactone hydrolase
MKFYSVVLFIFLTLQHFAQEINLNNRSQSICKFFKEDKTDSVHYFFSQDVKLKMSAQMLSTVWQQVKQQMGSLKEFSQPINRTEIAKNFYTAVFTFENMQLELRLPFNDEGYLVGLFFAPIQNATEYKMPSYSFKGEYSEVPLEINNGPVKLKALFTKPNKKKFPCVILVHGSGPGDMDETIGKNKPFKDIAIGLAQQGIGTIRYDKRTLNYKEDSLTDTPTKEVVSDAQAALRLALIQGGVDVDNVYILGHSFGGFMAPSIAVNSIKIKGIILMAAPARPLEQLLLEQYTYVLGLDSLDNDERRKLADLTISVNLIKNKNFTLQTPRENLPLHIPTTYWMELSYYNPLTLLQSISKNQNLDILVINGSMDYQVTQTDFNMWKEALKNNPKVEFKYYEGLYHLFMKGKGIPTDYDSASHIEEHVIKDIASFIR